MLTATFFPEQTVYKGESNTGRQEIQAALTPQIKNTSVICQCPWKEFLSCFIPSLHWGKLVLLYKITAESLVARMPYWPSSALYSTPDETILSQDEQHLREQVLIYNRSSFCSCGFVGQMFRGVQSIILMGGSINLAHMCLILPSLKPLRCIISLTWISDFSMPCLQKVSRLKPTVTWMKYKL